MESAVIPNLLLAFAALGMGLIAWRSRVWGAAVLLLLLPAYQVRFAIAGIPSTLVELLLLSLLVVWTLHRFAHGGESLMRLPFHWPVLLFVLAAAVAVYVSPDHTSALGFFKAYILEPIAFFIVVWDSARAPRDIRLLLASLGTGAVLLSGIALLQFLGLLPSPEPWVLEAPKRVTSLFPYPNALGLFLSPLVGLFGALAFVSYRSTGVRRRVFARVFPVGVAVAAALGTLAAVSRGGIIAMAIGLMLLGFLSVYRRATIIAVVSFLLVLLLVPTTRTTILGVASGADTSTDVRLVLWQGTWNLLREQPVVGAGLGGFPLLYDEFRLAKHTELLPYPHNIILNVWVELGLAGLAIFCWLVGSVVRKGMRVLRAHPAPFARSLALGTLTALLVLMLHGLVDVPYFKNDLAIEFWFLLSLIPLAERMANAGHEV